MNTNTLMLGTIAGRQDEQVRVGYDALASHMHILARTGAGKTTLKKLIFKQVVDAGYGCLFMTPAPDGTWEALALVPKHRVKDIVLIDPGDDLYPFAASPLALQDNRDDRTVNKAVSDAVNRMMHVCKKIWGPGSQEQSWGPQLENVLRNCLYTLILNNLTISELPLLIRDNDFRSLTVSAITDTSQWRWVRWFWQEDFGRWQDRLQIERTDSTLNKVLEFLVNPHIENIVGQRTNTLNFKQWMNEGKQNKIILIRLSENIEGLGEEAVKLLGVMIMAYIKEAVFARERILDKNERKFFPVLCDEFSLYAGDDFKTLLERGRAMNVPFIIGHQTMAQLTSEALREAVNQTVIKVTGQVTEQDAGSFAPLYALPPEAEKYEEKKSEEVSGYRPVLTYKRDVIGHLLAGAAYHKDERVRTFSKEYLRALNYAKEQRVREHQVDTLYGREYVTVLPTRLGFAYDPLDVPPALDTLNDWLYAGMRVSTALWQPLPAETLGWLANFFGFGQLVKLYSFKSEGASYSLPWYRFATKGKFVVDKNNRAGMGKIVRVEVFNRPAFARAVVTTVENSLIDFVAVRRPKPEVRRAWQQKAIDLSKETTPTIKTRSLEALERIIGALRHLAPKLPAIDAPLFEQYFLAELSKPEYALDVFLPLVLHTACEVSPDTPSYTIYRQTPVVSNGVVKLEESRTFDLQLYTLALYRGIAARLPAQLGQLTAFLRFLALLYCAQLALNQNPLYTMDSGEYEPNVHTQTHFLTTPRQSPTEMEGLMKGELINLDPWTAWCRVQDLSAPPGEKIKKYKIQIPNPQPLVTGSTLEERIDRIRDQSRLLIAPRQASVVEAEIRGRVALLRQQAKAAGDTVAALPGVPPAAQEEQEKKTSQRRHRTGQEP